MIKTVGLGRPYVVGWVNLECDIQTQHDGEGHIKGYATQQEAELAMVTLSYRRGNNYRFVTPGRMRDRDGFQMIVFSLLDFSSESVALH